MTLEPEIRHHRGDHALGRKLAAAQPVAGDERHKLIAVEHAAVLVDHDEAVGVAIERDAEMGA